MFTNINLSIKDKKDLFDADNNADKVYLDDPDLMFSKKPVKRYTIRRVNNKPILFEEKKALLIRSMLSIGFICHYNINSPNRLKFTLPY